MTWFRSTFGVHSCGSLLYFGKASTDDQEAPRVSADYANCMKQYRSDRAIPVYAA